MGFFGGRSDKDCEEDGGHDTRSHKRREPDGTQSTVADCNSCGKEWKYDDNGSRRDRKR